MKSFSLSILAVLALSGCTHDFTVQAMSRSDGKVYYGSARETGNGQGYGSININGVVYSGAFSQTSGEQYISFANAFAHNNTGGRASAFGTSSTIGANASFMAILTSPSGDGLRCGFHGDAASLTGGGLCVDAKKKIYDVIYQVTN